MQLFLKIKIHVNPQERIYIFKYKDSNSIV